MTGALYKNIDNDIKLNKSPEFVKNISFNLLGDCSIESPNILLDKDMDILGCNYLRVDYSPTMQYFYFIANQTLVVGKGIMLELELDDLYTFKDSINNAVAFIERSETLGNRYLHDAYLPINTNRNIKRSPIIGSFDSTLRNYLVVTGGTQ